MKNLITCISLAVFCFLSTTAFSQITYWNGKKSKHWGDPGNWSNGLPAPGNNAQIGLGKQVIISKSFKQDFNIVNNGGVLTINSDVYTIQSANALSVNMDGDLLINGKMVNNGAINGNEGSSLTIGGNGTLDNYGELFITDGGVGSVLFVGGTFNNKKGGILKNPCDCVESQGGTVNQCGTWIGGKPFRWSGNMSGRKIRVPYKTDNCK